MEDFVRNLSESLIVMFTNELMIQPITLSYPKTVVCSPTILFITYASTIYPSVYQCVGGLEPPGLHKNQIWYDFVDMLFSIVCYSVRFNSSYCASYLIRNRKLVRYITDVIVSIWEGYKIFDSLHHKVIIYSMLRVYTYYQVCIRQTRVSPMFVIVVW